MPPFGGLNPTLLKLELRRMFRNKRTIIFALVFPTAMFFIFGSGGQGDRPLGHGLHGNVSAYVMVSMALYGGALMAASGGAMVATERALGWSRQLRLTPLSPAASGGSRGDALADVRRAVEGYRELTLPGELARARAALAAVEIDAELPNSADEVPGDLRALFAWTICEGVINVLRHSGARSCAVVLDADAVEVRDDGRGLGEVAVGSGNGLTGLRERAAALGATVITSDLRPGFSLRVVAP